jgi:trk system potassium uptake protein
MIRLRRVLSAVASALRLFSFAFLLPVPVALAYERATLPLVAGIEVPATLAAFLGSFLAATLVWVPLRLATRGVQDDDLLEREGYLAVALGWLVAAVLAMLPFLASGEMRDPVDAFFEAMSGLTGTASTGLDGLASVPESLVFWRALLPWIGGLAIIVLLVALLARLTQGGLTLAQGTGIAGGARLRPKLAEAARSLWIMYASATLAVVAVLAFLLASRAGLDARTALFQGLVQGMGAYALGGIADPAGPWPGAGDWAVDLWLTVAMLVGGTNFVLTFAVLRRGDVKSLVANPEWRFYMLSFAAGAGLVALLLLRDGLALASAVHEAVFTAASLLTGTGTYIVDYATWMPATLFVLLLLMLLGASSGSPSGGVKAFRWLVLGRLVLRELRKLLHPKAMLPVRVGATVVKEDTVATIMAFFFTYLVAWTVGTVVLLAVEPRLDATDSAAAAASALGNVGAGFGILGPTRGYADLLPASKLLLAALMWLGRLEIFTALLLLHPLSWKT